MRPDRRLLFAIALLTVGSGCGSDPEKPPPPPGQTAGVSAGGGGQGPTDDSGGSTTGVASLGGMPTEGEPSCSPFDDPVQACGLGRECSFVDERCHDAPGTGTVGQPCTVTDPDLLLDDCAPALVCAFASSGQGRCLEPCTNASDCAVGLACVVAPHEAVPGLCVAPCDPLLQDCLGARGEACYPLALVGGQTAGACLPVGTADLDEACELPNDCRASMTCTDAPLHTSGCNGSASCCTLLCDIDNPECLGVDAVCYALDNPTQPSAGFCGAP